MPHRPLHRWKSFWLGVLVVVFLGWAWARSLTNVEFVFWRGLGVNQMSGIVHAYLFLGTTTAGNEPRFGSQSISESGPWLPKAFGVSSSSPQTDVRIAHWFLILLFLLPWTTWLVWRVRRMKRLASAPGTAGLQTGSNRP